MDASNPHPTIGYILRSYPRLSQTFILHEILALEQLGIDIHIFAITDPHESLVQDQVADVRAPVAYLELAGQRNWLRITMEHLRVMLAGPRRYFGALSYLLRRPYVDEGYTNSSRYTCFLQAVHLVHLLRRQQQCTGHAPRHLHAHFAHDPTLISLLAQQLLDISYSFTAHARDLYQLAPPALAERIVAASAVVTCCSANVAYLQQVAPAAAQAKVRLIHHGVNLEKFQPAPRLGRSAALPLILSVGRLVEKKGFPDLLHACQRLKQAGHGFCCLIYGEGPLQRQLAALIEELGLADDVKLAGACTQEALLPIFQQADIFVLTPYFTEDGDRDGVPNVLVEAMACGLPVVSTTAGSIPDLVVHDHNGLLAAPHDIQVIASGLATLLSDEPQRKRLGAAARRTVVEHFDLCRAAQQLMALFEQAATREPC